MEKYKYVASKYRFENSWRYFLAVEVDIALRHDYSDLVTLLKEMKQSDDIVWGKTKESKYFLESSDEVFVSECAISKAMSKLLPMFSNSMYYKYKWLETLDKNKTIVVSAMTKLRAIFMSLDGLNTERKKIIRDIVIDTANELSGSL